MNKSELVELVKHQVGVELANDKDNKMNSGRKVLYTQINRANYITVVSLLNRYGIRTESHIKDYYFVHFA